MVNEQAAKVYGDAWETAEKSEPIGWSTAIFPQELCETFNIPLVYPENNAASISTKHLEGQFMQHAEGEMRYLINICSYARLNIGMADKIIQPEL